MRTKIMKKSHFLWVIVLVLSLGKIAVATGGSVSNFTVPYTSYTFDFWGNAVPAPQAYLPMHKITGEDLGVGSFREANDFHVSSAGNIYIADTGNHRVIMFDSDWQFVREIKTFSLDGTEHTFAQPHGIYVTDDESLYVADTGNARIVQFDSQGVATRIIGEPKSDLEGAFPVGFTYRPLKVAVDGIGRMYVISQDLAEGFLSFSENGQFRGFVGAPRVTPDLIDYIWSRIATGEQRERLQIFLPTEYTNLALDKEGYIYATVYDDDDGEDRDKVVRLNARGENLLKKAGFHPPRGDIQHASRWSKATRKGQSTFVDVTVHDNGTYSVLDSKRARVFTYDKNDNLLFVFGYRGTMHGQVENAAALDNIGETMLILDSRQNAIFTYEPTDYALLIWAALDAYDRGDYQMTEAIWHKVLELNANFDQAYSGIGDALLRRGEYADAMYYFKLGNDRNGYSKAFELYRRGVIYDNFTMVSIIAAALLIVLVVYRLVRRKTKTAASEPAAIVENGKAISLNRVRRLLDRAWDQIRFVWYICLHPLEGFWKMKYEKKGNLGTAMLILAMASGTFIFSRQYTGFVFNTADLTRLNVPMEIASIVVPFFLWCGINWSLTTLMDGKGTFRDVTISSAYALVPLIITMIPLTVVSNYLIQREGAFYLLGISLGTMWTLILLVFGAVMTIHEYNFSKTVWTCIFTAAGMAFALFLGFLFFNLSEQVYMFFNEVISEIIFRT